MGGPQGLSGGLTKAWGRAGDLGSKGQRPSRPTLPLGITSNLAFFLYPQLA